MEFHHLRKYLIINRFKLEPQLIVLKLKNLLQPFIICYSQIPKTRFIRPHKMRPQLKAKKLLLRSKKKIRHLRSSLKKKRIKGNSGKKLRKKERRKYRRQKRKERK